MNLGDVLQGLGDAPLKEHTWTDAILSTLNAILPSRTRLSGDHTGLEALGLLTLLPENERTRLLHAEVDVFQGTLTIVASNTPAPSNDAKSETFHQSVVQDLLRDPSRSLTMAFGVLLVVVALVITIIMASAYHHTNEHPQEGILEALWRALKKLLVEIGNDF